MIIKDYDQSFNLLLYLRDLKTKLSEREFLINFII